MKIKNNNTALSSHFCHKKYDTCSCHFLSVPTAIKRYSLLVLFFFTGFYSTIAKAQAHTASVYDFSPVQNKIQSWIDSGYYKGASIIICKDNRVLYEKYFGNYEPQTVAHIASAGKWLAAATIAAVVDEGKLKWTDKVKKWLPQFTDVKGEATLAQLLSHTAGYPDYQPEGRHRDDYQTLKEAVAHIVDLPADTMPGAVFHYGGLAMQVAGRMAEVATGKKWETLFQEKIAKPLHMQFTHFTPVDTTPGHNPMLGGGARTSLHDYANFLNMIYNNGVFEGKRILSTKAVAVMQADHVGNADIHILDGGASYVKDVRNNMHHGIYGLGEWREEVNENGDATLISSSSWAGAYPWIDKKNGVYGFFLARIYKAQNGFNPFLSSPALAQMVRDVITNKEEASYLPASPYDAVYQYSVKVEGRTAYLWMPPQCKYVRGVIVALENALERNWMESPIVRKAAAEENLAMLWLADGKPTSITWEITPYAAALMDTMFMNLAMVSGYNEIANAPVIITGHSWNGRNAWTYPAQRPERVIASLPIRTYPLPDTLGFTGIPMCYIVGQTTELPQFSDGHPGDRDFYWSIPRQTAMALRSNNEKNLIGVVVNPGGCHMDWTVGQSRFVALFIHKACQYRLPKEEPADGKVTLTKITPQDGWLTDTGNIEKDTNAPAPYAQYKGDKQKAYWFFDEAMARAAVAFNGDRNEHQKQMTTLVQGGDTLPVQRNGYVTLNWLPQYQNNTFTLHGGFLDQVPASLIDSGKALSHAEAPVALYHVMGPAVQLNDTTFKVQFDRQQPRNIMIMADQKGDDMYRRATQGGILNLPAKLTTGTAQQIHFPEIPNQQKSVQTLLLHAVATSGLPVQYFVESGPAVIRDHQLVFTPIPVKSKYPVKVTVVACQWGSMNEPKYQSAEQVARTFLITK